MSVPLKGSTPNLHFMHQRRLASTPWSLLMRAATRPSMPDITLCASFKSHLQDIRFQPPSKRIWRPHSDLNPALDIAMRLSPLRHSHSLSFTKFQGEALAAELELGEESAVGAAAHNSDSWLTSRVHLVTSNENDRKTLIYALRERVRVREPADLKLLCESDLIDCGVRLPVARGFIRQWSVHSPDAAATNHEDVRVEMEGLMVDRSLNDAGTSASLLPSPPPSLLSSSPPNTEQSAYMALQAKGALQAHRPTLQSFSSSFMGGAYLAAGGALMVLVAGESATALSPGVLALIKGMVFPVGLSMIILSNSELMTGNLLTQALPSLRVSPLAGRMKVLGVSAAGNLAGSLLVVAGATSCHVFTSGSAAGGYAVKMAAAKCALPPLVAFGKGVGANWLVATAILQAATATSSAGKIAALWMPIATFVALGLEHSVANMFLIPLGMALGADVTVWDLAANLVFVTLGNAVGAALFIGGIQRISVFGPSGALRPPAP